MALLHHLPHLGGQQPVSSRDLRQVAGPKPTDLQLLHVVNEEISLVHHTMSQLAQMLIEPGDSDGGRTHVHPSATRAEVHGNTEDVDGLATRIRAGGWHSDH